MDKSQEAIGIFDSGIGGLTVAAAIKNLLPKEQLIYFGDTAHMPYGDKSAEAIKYYSLKIAKFLADKNCKCIVIACNTASSLSYDDLSDFLGDRIPIINVISPVVDFINDRSYKSVGVIGTKATISSNIYEKKINALNKGINTKSLATPLLAPMIEEGFFNNKISKTIINSYLSSAKLKKIEALILACTHYPLIRPEIELYFKEKVEIVNTAEIVAKYISKLLNDKKLLNSSSKNEDEFYVSDFTQSFEQSTKIFFPEQIKLQYIPIWEKK